jgi:two-component system response regulator
MSATEERKILLVEDNADDEALTIRALKRNNIVNAIDVVRDGAEALDYMFCRGAWSERDAHVLPQVVLLDLKLPKVGGLEVLKAIREDETLRFVRSYGLGANSYIRKPVDFDQFSEAVRTLGLYWLVLNETPQK